MLESNPDSGKRYAPPSQRNRSLNRRKSAGEKSQGFHSRNFPAIGQGETGNNNIQNETARPGLIPLNGCCISEASQLLNKRWAAALNSYNDPSIDLSDFTNIQTYSALLIHIDFDLASERPIMYSGASGSSWGNFKLPHQMDFLGELRCAVQNAPMSAVPPAAEHS